MFCDFRFSSITLSIQVLETSKRTQNLRQSKPNNFCNYTLALSALIFEFGRGQSSGGQYFAKFGQGHNMVQCEYELVSKNVVLDVIH